MAGHKATRDTSSSPTFQGFGTASLSGEHTSTHGSHPGCKPPPRYPSATHWALGSLHCRPGSNQNVLLSPPTVPLTPCVETPHPAGVNALPAVRAQPHGPSACPESKPPVFPTDRFSNWGPHHPCSGSAIC